MSEGPLALFFIVGVALLAGFVASDLGRRWRVSDVVLLLFVGLLVGPVTGLADGAALAPAFRFLGPLGLVIVLFEGGLELGWRELRRYAGRGLSVTLLVWGGTAAAVALASHLALGLAWPVAALLGVAVCSTGILVVVPLLQQIRAPPEARVVLTIETALGDLLSAVATTTLASLIVLSAPLRDGARILGFEFAVGAAVGLLAGLAWARVLHGLQGRRHTFALTLAALMLSYLVAEALGGSGYLMALAFGLVVGNSHALVSDGGFARLASPRADLRDTQGEIVFLLRSVYFVYLGLLIPLESITIPVLAGCAVVVGAMYLARVAAVRLALAGRKPDGPGDPTVALVTAIMPRGLATALIAAIPVSMGVPGAEAFLTYTFIVIVGCDVLTSAGILAYERARSRRAIVPAQAESGAAPTGGAGDELRATAGEP